MLRLSFIPMLAALLVAGCATPKPFPLIEQNSADAAKVRFSSRIDGAWIDLYPQSECNGGVSVVHETVVTNLVASAAGRKPKRVDMIDPVNPDARDVAEYAFQGGQVVNMGVGGSYRCLSGASFMAKAGEQYEATLRAEAGYGCVITVSKLVLKGGTPWRLPVEGVKGLVCKNPY